MDRFALQFLEDAKTGDWQTHCLLSSMEEVTKRVSKDKPSRVLDLQERSIMKLNRPRELPKTRAQWYVPGPHMELGS